jgi:hypothetical protein
MFRLGIPRYHCDWPPGGFDMAMELFVLSDRMLGSIAEWQRAIDADGFPLRLSDKTPFSELNGILPVQLEGHETEFECNQWDARELAEDYADMDFGKPWAHALAFRWGGLSVRSTPAVYMAAAAYARATDGAIFDCEEGKIITPQHAGEVARDSLRDVPKMEAALRLALERLKADFPGPSGSGGTNR